MLIQKRPLTRTNDELIEIAERIESASRLKFTDIYNNTNLSDQTDENTLFSGYDEIKMLSKKMGIVITKNCGIDKALYKRSDEFEGYCISYEISVF